MNKEDKAYLRIRARKNGVIVSEFLCVLAENQFSQHRSTDVHSDIEVILERIERDEIHDFEQEHLKEKEQ